MKYAKDRIIVLSRTDFGERDRIINVVGENNGKVSLIAKGSRSSKSKLAGGIELFCISEVQYVLGKGEVYTLTSARLAKKFSAISSDIDRTELAFDMLKRVNKIIEPAHGQEYFAILAEVFRVLVDNEMSPEAIRAWFAMKVLQESGHIPELKKDTKNQLLEEAEGYNFDLQSQRFEASQSGRYKTDDIKLLRVMAGAKSVPKINTQSDSLERTCQLLEQLLYLQLY